MLDNFAWAALIVAGIYLAPAASLGGGFLKAGAWQSFDNNGLCKQSSGSLGIALYSAACDVIQPNGD